MLLFLMSVSFAEWLLQLCWAPWYFCHGVPLRAVVATHDHDATLAANQAQNIFLRNFELRRLHGNTFAVRQGKFGIVRNIWFHGCASCAPDHGQTRVAIFIDFHVLLLSALVGMVWSGHWWGAIGGAALAWLMARYFADRALLESIAERVRIHARTHASATP